jgi:hypothetical protein
MMPPIPYSAPVEPPPIVFVEPEWWPLLPQWLRRTVLAYLHLAGVG